MVRTEVPADLHEAVEEKDPGEGEVVVASPHAVADPPRVVPRKTPVREPERRRIAAIAGVAPSTTRGNRAGCGRRSRAVHAGDEVDPATDADAEGVNGPQRPRQRGEFVSGIKALSIVTDGHSTTSRCEPANVSSWVSVGTNRGVRDQD